MSLFLQIFDLLDSLALLLLFPDLWLLTMQMPLQLFFPKEYLVFYLKLSMCWMDIFLDARIDPRQMLYPTPTIPSIYSPILSIRSMYLHQITDQAPI